MIEQTDAAQTDKEKPEIPRFADGVTAEQLQQELSNLEPELRTQRMEQILEEVCVGPGKCTIDRESPFEGQIDLSTLPLSGADRAMAQRLLSLLISLKNMPMISDGFGQNHGDPQKKTGRRGWRWHMNQLFGDTFIDVYSNNKLRWQKLGPIWSYAGMLRDVFKNYPELSDLNQAINQFIQKFQDEVKQERPNGLIYNNEFKLEERYKAAKAIDLALSDLLNVFPKQKPPQAA